MNKLLKTTLISAIFATSGFATEISSGINEGTTFDIDGNVTVNNPISVGGTLDVQGGTLQNNDVITFKKNILNQNSGSLLIKNAFKAGDLVGTVTSGNVALADISSAGFNRGYWEFVDSSETTYSDEDWSSTPDVTIKGGKFQNRVPLTAETYEQAIANLKDFECSGINIRINWTDISEASVNIGVLKQNSTPNASIDDSSYANCFPTQGVLDFTDATYKGTFTGPIQEGTVKLSRKTTANFSQMSAQDIVGVYEYKTEETDYVETTVNDENYIISKRTNADQVLENAETQFKKRFNDSVALSESINPNFYAFGDESGVGDQRRSYTGLIGSTASLNAKGNILLTSNIIPTTDDVSMQSAISKVTKKERDDTKILSVDRESSSKLMEIHFSLEGSDNLEFQDSPSGSIPNSGKLTFSGDNSGYTGTVSVSGITSITASGNNTLPHKLAEDFSSTELVIASGENTIDTNSRESATTIKSLQLNGGSLTIAKGTSIVIGSNS